MMVDRSLVIAVVLLVVQSHSLDVGTVTQQTACRAVVNNTLIDLKVLSRGNIFPRVTVLVEDGWRVAWNPCTAFNLPPDPHSGLADQCFHVAMCRYKPGNKSLDGETGEYYTMGIHRLARFSLPVSQHSPANAPAVTSHHTSTSRDLVRTTPCSGGGATHNASLICNETNHLSIAVTTRPSTGEDDVDDDDDVSTVDETDDSTDASSYDSVDDDANSSEQVPAVAALIYKGIRSMTQHRSVVNIVCVRPPTSSHYSPAFLYIGHTRFQHYFQLRFCCCCVDDVSCSRPDKLSDDDLRQAGSPLNDSVLSDDASKTSTRPHQRSVVHSAQSIWLLLLVNASILLIALGVAALCCRRAGVSVLISGPYSYIPGVHGSDEDVHMTSRRASITGSAVTAAGAWPGQSSSKSTASAAGSALAADYRDYCRTNAIRSSIPLLDNCVIPFNEIDIGQRLGGGLFCDTYIGQWRSRRVAVKRITVGVHQSQIKASNYEWIVNNVALLSNQRHQLLVSVVGVCIDARQPYVIQELTEGESLRQLIRRSLSDQTSNWTQRIRVCIETANGLTFLHSSRPPILHRDLRAANILMDNTGKVKIVDFGFTKIIQKLRNDCDKTNCFCQRETCAVPAAMRWTAPEILADPVADEATSDVFSTACDVYSFAMVLWELATCCDPFEDIVDDIQVTKLVVDGARPPVDLVPHDTLPHYIELMKVCWDHDPTARPHFKQISQYLKSILQTVKSSTPTSQLRERTDSVRSTTTGYLRSVLNLSTRACDSSGT